ncbi:MAG: response regulator [Deltaproteobacteria bacterium]|jgi:signal transduction histidine kinase/FixJ family two-component response regulator/HPt (histidine-containing phosphotransfer) domain-containing protein|nr:response regulator [Deltaproteobacteria bacterium]
MEWKKRIKANRLYLFLIFLAFFLIVLISCVSINHILTKALFTGAEETLLAAEANIKADLAEVDLVLGQVGNDLRDMLDKGESQEDILKYLNRAVRQIRQKKSTGGSETAPTPAARQIRQKRTGVLSFYRIRAYIRGDFFDSAGIIQPGEEYTPQEQPWYDAATRAGGVDTVYTVPYADARAGSMIFSAARNIYDKTGEHCGILALDADFSWFSAYAPSLLAYSGGYGIIANQHMIVVGHSKSEFLGRPLGQIGGDYARIYSILPSAQKTVSLRLKDTDGTEAVFFLRQMFNGWNIGLVVPFYAYYRDLHFTAALLSLLGLALAMLLSFILLRLSGARMRADEENREKSAFLARMSHEIRTPLNAVIGMSELALNEEKPPKVLEYVAGIKKSGTNLLSIVNDILDLSKIGSGNLRIEAAPYMLASVLNDAISIARVRISKRALIFTANVDARIPACLIGDETRIREVLNNLLSNAVKYTREGFIAMNVSGEFTGEHTIVLNIDVRDSGIGIKKEDMGSLFSSFIRLDTKSNRGIEGSGLGLMISRSISRAMGGDISVSSEYGKGSLFRFTFPQSFETAVPLAEVEKREKKSVLFHTRLRRYSDSILRTLNNLGVEAMAAPELDAFLAELRSGRWAFAFVPSYALDRAERAVREERLRTKLILLANLDDSTERRGMSGLTMPAYCVSVANMLNEAEIRFQRPEKISADFIAPAAKVLVVDDIDTNLQVTAGFLSLYQMEVQLCSGGQEAVFKVREQEYDLVFMDHMMPGMDGMEATARIRAMEGERFRNLPIIALTANALSGVREIFLKNGFNDYLPKPIEALKLRGILERWLPAGKRLPVAARAQAPAPSRTSRSKLDIPGLDVEAGIAGTGGSESGYINVLSLYCRDAAGRLKALRAMPAAGDQEALRLFTTQVHALKSASASIGAKELAEMATRLEEAGNAGDTQAIRAHLVKFCEGLGALVERIGESMRDRQDNAGGGARPDREKLLLLKKALAEEDMKSIDELLESLNSSPLEPSAGKLVAEISELILMSEFHKASAVIDVMIG